MKLQLGRQQHHRDREGLDREEQDTSDHGSTTSGHSGHSGGSDDIPIRVQHEKHKYGGGGRNTTELPARPTREAGGSESPRLERAASEPPGKFGQRLNLSKPAVYSTIPENSEDRAGPGRVAGGQGPAAAAAQKKQNPIKMSASAPSVPGTSQSHQQQPVPPAPFPERVQCCTPPQGNGEGTPHQHGRESLPAHSQP